MASRIMKREHQICSPRPLQSPSVLSLWSFRPSAGVMEERSVSTPENKLAACISDEASLHKSVSSVTEEPPVITSPGGHYNTPADRMQSPPAPNLSRSQEKPFGQELSESHKQEVDRQGRFVHICSTQNNSATTASTHVNASNTSCTEPLPHKHPGHTQNSPQHNTRSPAHLPQNLLPPCAPEFQNSSQHMSENKQYQQSEHQHNTQKQLLPHIRQISPPQSHPESSPQQMTHNTEQNHSVPSQHTPQRISPQCSTESSPVQGMSQSITQGAQPRPPQPAPLTSLPPSHPTPLLPSQPSPADLGDQRPSEPTSRPDSEGPAISPLHTLMSPGPPTSIYKHQAFSPNHNQTQLMGSTMGMQAQRGPPHSHSPAVPPHSQGQVNGAMGQYGMGNPLHPHYNLTNMNRPMPPSPHHPYHNQPISNPTFHHQGGNAYSYQIPGQQHPHALRNIYPSNQYQQQAYYTQPYSQTHSLNQAVSREGYHPKEWQQSPHQPIPPNAYLPVASARSNSQSKESNMSPLSSEGSKGTGLLPPGPVAEVGPHTGGSEEEKCEGREQAGSSGNTAKQAHNESSEQPESPKEILDLDSHNAAARHRNIQPLQQHPLTSAAPLTSGFMYDPRALHPGMQQGGIPPPHMMSQGHGVGNRIPYPGQPYPDPERYAAQRPHPHLMEALQRPQQLPYSPGQTRMAMYRPPRPGGHFQGMMIQQRGLGPERFLHPGQQMMAAPGSSGSKQGL